MNKISTSVVAIVLPVLFSNLFFTSCSGDNKENKTPPDVKVAETKTSAIDGSWDLVWASYNGKDAKLKKSSQFKMFHDGFFSLIAWDPAGKLDYCGYGKYELEGKIYKETFLYHNNPEYAGGMDWQEFELKGDTLYSKGFNKVIIGGKDVTADFPKFEEKRVRAK